MPRIYVPISHIIDNRISITDEKAHYLISVLRCRKGDDLIVFDGKGDCFRTTILKADRKEIIAEEASRQSGRSIIPIVHDPMKFSDIFHLLPPSNKVNGLIFYEEGGMKLSEAVEIFKQRFNYTLPLSLPSYVL